MQNYAILLSNSSISGTTVIAESDDQNKISHIFYNVSIKESVENKAIYKKIIHEKVKTITQHIIDETKKEEDYEC